jgi:outer membrane protein OmpA-like peptidoglycan-associated protein
MRLSALPIVLLLLSGCLGSGSVALRQISGESDIPDGSQAKIIWQFDNADFVRIDNDSTLYGSRDSIVKRPSATTTYRLVAFNKKGDSSVHFRTINVYKPTSSGLAPGLMAETQPAIPREFLNTPAPIDSLEIPARLKIMRLNQINENTYAVHALVLNDYGRALQLTDPVFNGITNCNEEITKAEIQKTESALPNRDAALTIIALDHSISTEAFHSVYLQLLRSFAQKLNSNNRLSIITFNQLPGIWAEYITPDSAAKLFLHDELLQPDGGRAVYRASLSSIELLKNVPAYIPKQIIILTSGADNASVIAGADEVAQAARNSMVPIHVVRAGNDGSDNYTLKYLASVTGGNYYTCGNDEIEQVSDAMAEIINYLAVPYYTVEIPLPARNPECKGNQALTLELQSNAELPLKSTVIYQPDPETRFPAFQSLAFFRESNSLIDAGYHRSLQSFAEVLKSNSDKVVELIGHASMSELETDAISLAVQRASAVRRYLLSKGVDPQQIRARGDGNARPLFFTENAQWQMALNRRVEVRWLDPETFPFEILAETVSTEELALKTVEKWESRGLQAYFERRMQRNTPFYQIKLWGYTTIEQARETARIAAKRYNAPLRAEE